MDEKFKEELKYFKSTIMYKAKIILVSKYGYSREEADNMVEKAKLEEEIIRNPQLLKCLTLDQVLKIVLDKKEPQV